jgi:serine protease Do
MRGASCIFSVMRQHGTAEAQWERVGYRLMHFLIGVLAAMLTLGSCAPTTEKAARNHVLADPVASTVQVFAERGTARRAGSAVVLAVDPDGGRSLLLTAGHLVEPPVEQTIHIGIPFKDEHLQATLLGVDAERDLALLEMPSGGLLPVQLETETGLGEPVWVVAFPWGRRRTVVGGVVSQLALEEADLGDARLQGTVELIDASVSYGMSGGGVFEGRSGRLIGIVRGYRTAQLSLPGTGAETLSLPVAGETTVVPTHDILCFLEATAGVSEWRLASSNGRAC